VSRVHAGTRHGIIARAPGVSLIAIPSLDATGARIKALLLQVGSRRVV
jgi:hypothetical protein